MEEPKSLKEWKPNYFNLFFLPILPGLICLICLSIFYVWWKCQGHF